MAVTTQKREDNFKKFVGFVEGDVIAVNPTMDELNSMGFNVDKEPEYLKEVDDIEKDADGNEISKKTINQLTIAFYIKNKKAPFQIFNTRFFLKDKIRMNKDKTKKQYINSQGTSSWASDQSLLPEFLTKNGQTIREAYDGEADFYEFVRKWLNQADFKADYEIYFPWKDLMRGKIKEIKDLINDESAGSVMCPLTVRVTDDGKEYQQIFNKGIGAGYLIKTVRTKKIDDNFIELAQKNKNEKKKLTALERIILEMDDSTYGCTDAKYYGEMIPYDEAGDFVRSNDTVASFDDEDAGY